MTMTVSMCTKDFTSRGIVYVDNITVIFSSFFFFRKKLPIVVVRDVRPSVEIISFRGNSLSNRPIDLKIGLNVREGVMHVRKAWFFRNSHCKLQIFCNLCCNSCKLRKILPYFPGNYRSCFNLYFNLWPNLLFTVNSKCEYTIHERYDFYTQ